MVSTVISPQKISRSFQGRMIGRNRRGFTLMEILIVMSIFAAIAAFGIPKLFQKGDNIRKVARQMTALTKELRNRAKLKNATVRLVINMGAEKQTYWVEYTEGSKPISADLYDEGKSQAERELNRTQIQFKRDELLSKKDKALPDGLFFAAVETVNSKGPITQGKAYIHYFPEGFVEAAVVQITNRKELIWTLVISPLTGQAEIIEEEKFLKDL